MADVEGADDATGPAPRWREAPVGAVLDRVAGLLSAVGTVWIGLLMLLVVADVLGRNLLDAPITGVAEVAAHSVVAIVFLQVAAAAMRGRLTRADFLLRRIEARAPRAAALLDAAFSLVGAAVFGAIVWASWGKMTGSWSTGEYFGVQGVFTVPVFPFRAIIVVGAALAVLTCLWRAGADLRGPGGGARP